MKKLLLISFIASVVLVGCGSSTSADDATPNAKPSNDAQLEKSAGAPEKPRTD